MFILLAQFIIVNFDTLFPNVRTLTITVKLYLLVASFFHENENKRNKDNKEKQTTLADE